MEKTPEYIILSEICNEVGIEKLQENVNTHLFSGWRPLGQPFVTPDSPENFPMICQAIVRHLS